MDVSQLCEDHSYCANIDKTPKLVGRQAKVLATLPPALEQDHCYVKGFASPEPEASPPPARKEGEEENKVKVVDQGRPKRIRRKSAKALAAENRMSIGRFLIMVGDDLGYCLERNRGVFEAFERGSVTRASLMMNAAGTSEAVNRAKDIGLPLGLHLNITEGSPLSDLDSVNTLLNGNGYFLGKMGFRRALYEGHIDLKQVELEMSAQLDFFQTLAGYHPLYVDGHQHVHILPGLADTFARVLCKHGVHSTRLPYEPDIAECDWIDAPRQGFYQEVSQQSLDARATFDHWGICYSDAFVGMATMGQDMSLERLCARILSAFEKFEVHSEPDKCSSSCQTGDVNAQTDKLFKVNGIPQKSIPKASSEDFTFFHKVLVQQTPDGNHSNPQTDCKSPGCDLPAGHQEDSSVYQSQPLQLESQDPGKSHVEEEHSGTQKIEGLLEDYNHNSCQVAATALTDGYELNSNNNTLTDSTPVSSSQCYDHLFVNEDHLVESLQSSDLCIKDVCVDGCVDIEVDSDGCVLYVGQTAADNVQMYDVVNTSEHSVLISRDSTKGVATLQKPMCESVYKTAVSGASSCVRGEREGQLKESCNNKPGMADLIEISPGSSNVIVHNDHHVDSYAKVIVKTESHATTGRTDPNISVPTTNAPESIHITTTSSLNGCVRPVVCEYMTHPGQPSVSPAAGCGEGPDEFACSTDRVHELNIISSPEFAEFLKAHHIQLISDVSQLYNMHRSQHRKRNL